MRAVLTALLCLALEDRPLFLTEVTRLLFCQLPPASAGCSACRAPPAPSGPSWPPTAGSGTASTRSCPPLTPQPLPKNRRLTAGELRARIKPMTPDQATAARDRLEALVNALLEASVSRPDRAKSALLYDGGTGLDATPVPLFSRGPSKRSGLCASDPDGGWYVREGDHREREDDKGKPLRKLAWALEATIATTARPPRRAARAARTSRSAWPWPGPAKTPAAPAHESSPLPPPAGTSPAGSATTVPTPQALPERFHLPARALGYRPVMDYRIDQLGIQANTGGAILVEGTWYCPALPGPLITATTGLRGHAITRELYDQQITARACYQLKRKDGPTPTATSGCPAPPPAATPG